jgi:hypothetical protein
MIAAELLRGGRALQSTRWLHLPARSWRRRGMVLGGLEELVVVIIFTLSLAESGARTANQR